MAATVLNSKQAIKVSIFVVRAFVEMRESLAQHKELHRRVDELETTLDRKLGAHDRAIAEILAAIRQLMTPPAPAPKPSIGFVR